VQQPKSLWQRRNIKQGYTRHVAARSVEARYKTQCNRVTAYPKDNRNRGGGSLGCQRSWRAGKHDDDIHLTANEISGK
jgi:hypothetical protein